ncbi:MAG: DM13 domain-containing protein [Bacteroidota bacterium]
MKKQLLNSILIFAAAPFLACSKQNGTDTTPGTGMINSNTAVLKYSGSFINGPYGTVTGDAQIYLDSGRYTLKLQDVNISNGPDLHVYLSKEVQPVNYIDLGRLQSISGNHVYAVSGSPDFTQYKYALIHCQRFNHLFGSAELR